MEIRTLKFGDDLWNPIIEYAQNCSWKAGPVLAKQMQENVFIDWQRVFAAYEGQHIAGYCTITETDVIPSVSYTPYIGFVFVGEEYRGQRLSEQMIKFALAYAKNVGFKEVYLVSREKGLYEKYGFVKIDQKENSTGYDDQIFRITV
ncbi:GNAT family N-acetyltransferase [Chitinophaga flava]|uniref:GNAT family N-acetyltransferase n=1 Tax=Chitinophaga flava TaxID=2259036 RepID=A0A365XUZ4_9BACT|nr:GNAT family N-acetyltransferase [Chitinophaga flava]RBL89415.1 GNAT family N-acetyltransferase [Chitinophaga flava]